MRISILGQVLSDAWRSVKLGYLSSRRDHYGYIHSTAVVLQPCFCNKRNTYLYEHTNIGENSSIINHAGKFIMKKYSVAAGRLNVICQNHNFFEVGTYPGDTKWSSGEIVEDVIVDEHVWIGANVTLCPGTHIGRGCLVAAGAVCVKSKKYPPYTIIGGNPAKVIKYRFTLEEQIEHEKLIYPLEERLDPLFLKEIYEVTIKSINKKCP